jgi:predicted TIM-barrel fold metal-dependent hydrolase
MTELTALIDFHHHALPATLIDAYTRAGTTVGGWTPRWPGWSAGQSLAQMDDQGTRAAVLSISAPGVHLGDDARARTLAAKVNDELAEVAKDRPDRFGFVAALPLPDVEGAIQEATRALDELGADGVGVMANSHGQYLFDPAVEPLLAELDRREALIVEHPSSLPGPDVTAVPAPVADFPLDTTRVAFGLVSTGAMDRFARLRVVLAHAGGLLPYLAERFVEVVTARIAPGMDADRLSAGLRRFWLDTALSTGDYQLPSILAFAAPEKLIYGSDLPWAPPAASDRSLNRLARALDPNTARRVAHSNAAVLVPRLGHAG